MRKTDENAITLHHECQSRTLYRSFRFWQEPLEPIWQYRGKYYLGKTDDVEDKDQVRKLTLGVTLFNGVCTRLSMRNDPVTASL